MNKIPLLLLSGTMSDERLWQHQTKHLAPLADIHIPDLTQHSDIKELARAILKNAPDTFALAGFSMGGIIAQELLQQAPERVERLALIGTSTGMPGPDKRKLFQTWHSASPEDFEQTLKTLPTWVHPSNKQVAPLITQMGQDLGLEVFRRQGGILLTQRNDDPDLLRRFTRPTLIIHGENDPASSVEGNMYMADLFPKARRIMLSGCGHYASLEKPDTATALLSYWLQEKVD